MVHRLAVLALLIGVVPAQGQSTDLRDLFAGTNIPLTMKLGDLDNNWRRFTTTGASDMASLGAMYSAIFGGTSAPYYTRGQTVPVNGETYLIAYRPRTKPIDYIALMRSGPNPPQMTQKLTPDTALSLSLLNLRTVGSLTDIRPFDLKQEVAESESAAKSSGADASPAGDAASSSSNLKQLGLALLMYTQDYDNVLPPMRDAATVKPLLMPYVKNERVFIQPDSKQPYRPNPVLSRRKVKQITKPAEMIAFYEASPGPDQKRGVLYLDGHVARIPEPEWPRAKRASKIP